MSHCENLARAHTTLPGWVACHKVPFGPPVHAELKCEQGCFMVRYAPVIEMWVRVSIYLSMFTDAESRFVNLVCMFRFIVHTLCGGTTSGAQWHSELRKWCCIQAAGRHISYKTDRARPTAPRVARKPSLPNPTQPCTAVQPYPTPNTLPNPAEPHRTQPNPTEPNPTLPTQPI